VLAALLGGLLIGSCTLVRVDAAQLTLLVPVLGWLWLKRRALVWPLCAGLLIGLAWHHRRVGAVQAVHHRDQARWCRSPLLAVLIAGTAAAWS
jgi:hypothetical protein